MTEASSKLTVRIKLPKRIEADQEADHDANLVTGDQVAYRWDRILGVALVLVIVGFVVVRALVSTDTRTLSSDAAAEMSSTQNGEQPALAVTDSALPLEPAEPVPAPVATAIVGDESSAGTLSNTENIVADQRESGVPEVKEGSQPEQPVSAALAESADPGLVDRAETGTAAAVEAGFNSPEATGNAAPANRAVPEAVLTAGQTRILSRQVERFLITQSIKSREPVGTIEDISVQDASTGLVSVYVFSDVRGLAGKTLYYRWFKGDKLVANVRVGVGSDRWRSSSSKILNSSLKGSWRVELATADGDLLAITEFVY